ncbi:MAG TPA: ATP-dependent sacrificial sulfur transferase LarE [Gemmatimonadaceae bacterium]|nr:ATP-dependent sacrificial sulfur transferase LarE [Gemmatimonadaceae bacterium]
MATALVSTADHESALSREAALTQWLCARARVAIGYSGGVDSAYLAAVAIEALGAANVLGLVGRSASYPDAQWQAARDAAGAMGLVLREIDTFELDDPRYAANPANRCYFCKTELWSKVVPVAHEAGFATVVDGTNADDLRGHRPGAAAAREWGVASPLAELGFSKAEIRRHSARRALPTADQPASPCLSSRLPTGTAVTPLRLARVDAAERAVRALGVRGDLRVRYHGDTARIELSPAELAGWRASGARAPERAVLRDAVVRAGFTRVELDLRGFRSGKANEPPAPGDLDVIDD